MMAHMGERDGEWSYSFVYGSYVKMVWWWTKLMCRNL